MIYLLLKFGSFLTHVCCFLTSSTQWKTLIIDRNATVTFTVFSVFHKYTSKNNLYYLCGTLCNKYVNIIIMFQIQIYVIVWLLFNKKKAACYYDTLYVFYRFKSSCSSHRRYAFLEYFILTHFMFHESYNN